MSTSKTIKQTKTKNITFVYFGSDDMADMPGNQDYQRLLTRVAEYGAANIKMLPMTMVGTQMVRLKSDSLVLAEGEVLKFKPITNSRRAAAAAPDVTTDTYVKRAMTQLDLFFETGKPECVVVPYYVQVVKEKK